MELALTAASIGATLLANRQSSKKPKLEPTPLMPDPNDAAAVAARRRKQEETMATKGRASTVLDDDSFTGGSGSYVNDTLGS